MSAGLGHKGPVHDARSFQDRYGVSRETLARFETYAALLNRWQKAVQLVAPSTIGDVWGRHFADSAQLVELAPAAAATWLDLGSGAGFPGLVVALLLQERRPIRVTLIESDSRKAAFLREVARQTGAPVDIFSARIEFDTTQAKVGTVDVISARALAPLERLLGLAYPYWHADTVGLFPKGRDAEAELSSARARWSFDAELVPSASDGLGKIIVVRNLAARTEGEPRDRPRQTA